MIAISQDKVEGAIAKVIEEINEALGDQVKINIDSCPGNFFKSQVLVTAIGRIAKALNVLIPDNCYIFFDKNERKQLSIKEASKKLIKQAKTIKSDGK